MTPPTRRPRNRRFAGIPSCLPDYEKSPERRSDGHGDRLLHHFPKRGWLIENDGTG